METVIYTFVGFLAGATTSYFSYKLGSRTYKEAIEYYSQPAIQPEQEYESDNNNGPALDWNGYEDYNINGPQDEEPKA